MPVQTIVLNAHSRGPVPLTMEGDFPPVVTGGFWHCCQCAKPNDSWRSTCDNCGHSRCDGC